MVGDDRRVVAIADCGRSKAFQRDSEGNARVTQTLNITLDLTSATMRHLFTGIESCIARYGVCETVADSGMGRPIDRDKRSVV